MDKKALRRTIRERKAEHTAEELAQKSLEAIKKLETHDRFIRAEVVCLYSSLSDEVDTHDLIERYKAEKRILLPSIDNGVIELHEYGTADATQMGDFGITESCGRVFTDYDSIELAVIPGMAFDAEGNRLGRGKGYYDKFLPQIKAHKVGLCFDFQMLDTIPTLPHDIRMDEVIHSASAPATPSDGLSEL